VVNPPVSIAAATMWRERWFVVVCGQRRPVDVAFTTREAGGATTFRVTSPAVAAPGRG
jgi:hypothetical protein